MKELMIAASMAAVVNMAYVASAAAQAADEAAADDDFLNSLQEEQPQAPAESGENKTSAAEPKAAPAEAAPAEAAPAATASSAPATAATPAAAAAEPESAEAAAAKAEAPLDVIPVPQQQAASPPAAAAPPPKPRGVIEEIIVTAQRREQSAQDVPISITVLDAKQITNANITNSSDLAVYTPSLSTNQRFGSDNATFSIRGFTQELRTTASVATYFAEVVAPRGQSSQTSGDGAGPGALFDLQNVQVLKGPQGTLFGRNTTGGAVLIVPRKPTDELDGYVELSGGEWGMRRIQAVMNVPVSDFFRVRAGVDRNERDGHLKNISGIGADELANVEYLSGRLSTVFDLGESIENYTILSYIDSDSNGYSTRLFACNPNPDPTSNPFFAFTGRPCQQQLDSQAASGQDGFYDMISTIKTPLTAIKERRAINTLTWELSEDVTLKNILAYAHLHTENGSDIFGTQFHAFYDPDPVREFKVGISVPNPNEPVTSQETKVAELQLQGNSFEGDLEWQTGVYWEKSSPDGFSGNNSSGLISCEVATIEGDPSGFNCFDPFRGQLGSVLVQEYKTTYKNKAAYAQGTYHILDPLSVTLGLRYTWDESFGYGRKTRYTFDGPVRQAPTTQVTEPRVKSDAPTGLIEMSYKPFEEGMLYAKYLRGYRQGNVILAADPGVDTFDPEKVDTYEVGAKTSFGGPIPGRFNVAVFYNDFTDQQLQFGYISPSAGPTTTIANAGKSRIQGLEAEAFFQLLERVTLALSYSYLDTELLEQMDYTDRVTAAGGPVAGATATPIADVGDELPYAPEQSYVASLNWRLPVSESLGEIDAGVTYSYVGQQRSAATSTTPFGMLDAFNLLNLNMSWASIFRTSLDLSLFATNVLDEQYTTYTGGTYSVLGFESRMMGQPRLIGARLKYNFGADGE